jgi:ATP-binding cassette subfamily G (WHITE) protein 2
MGTLTVRENLMFSANLRLPETVPLEEKKQRVEDTIRDLGIEKCANTKVINAFVCDVRDTQ